MMRVVRTREEITDLLENVNESIAKGDARFRAMTFEEGVRDTMMWLSGESDDHPYPPE